MTAPIRPEEFDSEPPSEPPTLITTVNPADELAGVHVAVDDPRAAPRPMPSPIGDDPGRPASPPPEPVAAAAPEPVAAKKPRARLTLRIPDDEVARPSRPVTPAVSPVAVASPVPPAVAATLQPEVAPGPKGAIVAQRIINLKVDTPTAQVPVSTAASPAAPVGPAAGNAGLVQPPQGAGGVISSAPVGDTAAVARSVTIPGPPVRPPEEDSWTPFQPTVADHEPPESSLSVDIAFDTGAFEHEPSGPAQPAPRPPPAEDVRSVPQVAPAPVVVQAAPSPPRPPEAPVASVAAKAPAEPVAVASSPAPGQDAVPGGAPAPALPAAGLDLAPPPRRRSGRRRGGVSAASCRRGARRPVAGESCGGSDESPARSRVERRRSRGRRRRRSRVAPGGEVARGRDLLGGAPASG